MDRNSSYKPKLTYSVRSTQAPGELQPSIVPVIVERIAPTSLADVVENCIDRGLVAGLKPTAAEGIADGIARQIARELASGRGVKFGQYFYGRPYLSGTVGANGRLTDENSINVRLYKGEAFKLRTEDFQLSFDGAADAVKVDYIFGDASEGGNVRGQVVTGSGVIVQGLNLYSAGDTNKVTFVEQGSESDPVVVTSFTSQSANLLSFAWPAGLVAGKRYDVIVERTDANGVTRVSTGKTVDVVAGSAPVPTGPTVTAINDGTFSDGSNVVTGANMRFSDAYPATHVTIKTADGHQVSAMIGDDGSVEPSPERFALSISVDEEMTPGAEYTFEFAMIDENGDPVTVTKTARWAE